MYLTKRSVTLLDRQVAAGGKSCYTGQRGNDPGESSLHFERLFLWAWDVEEYPIRLSIDCQGGAVGEKEGMCQALKPTTLSGRL